MQENYKSKYLDYWENNIDKWGELYLEQSHSFEQLNGSKILTYLYQKTIYRLESLLMKKRYEITMKFIENYVKEGVRFNDIGCGTGIFTIAALKKGAIVNAIDFSDKALMITKERVKVHAGDFIHNVKYFRLNVENEKLPASDISMAMGVTPYIKDIQTFYRNTFNCTDYFYCQITDSSHYLNKLRQLQPYLNVRNLIFHSKHEIEKVLNQQNIQIVSRDSFATGFIDLYKKQKK